MAKKFIDESAVEILHFWVEHQFTRPLDVLLAADAGAKVAYRTPLYDLSTENPQPPTPLFYHAELGAFTVTPNQDSNGFIITDKTLKPKHEGGDAITLFVSEPWYNVCLGENKSVLCEIAVETESPIRYPEFGVVVEHTADKGFGYIDTASQFGDIRLKYSSRAVPVTSSHPLVAGV